MVTTDVLTSRTPLSTDVSRSGVLAGPCRIPRRLRGINRVSAGIVGSGPAILHRLLGAHARRGRGRLAGVSL
jgi:hypothetical protein